MKFAVVALIATTSAIRIEAQGKGCATKEKLPMHPMTFSEPGMAGAALSLNCQNSPVHGTLFQRRLRPRTSAMRKLVKHDTAHKPRTEQRL